MLVYEIPKRAVKNLGSVEKAIKNGYFVSWDDNRIKNAFNDGNGTINDFRRYVINNKQFCHYIDAEVDA